MPIRPLAISLLCLAFVMPARAADFSDPTWPCVQRKVVDLSIGQMLPFIIPELEGEDPLLEQNIKDLSQKLALRRFPVEELAPEIAEFASNHPGNAALGALFSETFDSISRQRKLIISGIGRYAAKQTSLSEQIETQRAQMKTLMEATEPDFDKVDAIEEKLDWDERIYQDRVRALTYVCESPVLLEKRAFAIAKEIQKHWVQTQ